MRSLFAPLALGLFAFPLLAADKDEKKTKDEDAILGTWKVDKVDVGNTDTMPDSFTKKVRYTFHKDGKLDLVTALTSTEGKYKLDPDATPKALDITEGKKTTLGLYELTGDTLKVCWPFSITKQTNLNRPTEIKADGKGVVFTLVRVKDEKKDK